MDILANDTDADGAIAPSTVKLINAPVRGVVDFNLTNGVVTYTPAAGFSGTDMFSYTVKDNLRVTSNAATVAVSVTPRSGDRRVSVTPRSGGGGGSLSALLLLLGALPLAYVRVVHRRR